MSARTSSAERLTGPSSARLISPVLVGRAAELAALAAAVRRPPAVIEIEGDAGIGKTRLIRDWLTDPELAGAAHLIGHCSPLREPLPFGPVIDALTGAISQLPEPTALSPVTGALRPLLPELADRLPPALEPLRSRQQGRHRVFRGIRDLLAGLGPAVLVLEDLHWIDHGTRELLRFLTDRPPEQLILVLTYRREDLADPTAPALVPPLLPGTEQLRLALRPLDPAQVAELVSAVFHTEVSPELARHLHERTMGIPLAIEEALRLLADRQPAGADIAQLPDQLNVPSALRDALLERASRLGRSARRLLHAAAILGNPATEDMLVGVAGLAPQHSTAGLTELVSRALLGPDEDGRYSFRHRLAQQAIHDSLPEPTRRALHRRAVTVLSSGDEPRPLGQLAYHCRAAGLIADWQRYAEAAADQAIALGDDETAAELLRNVVAHPEVTTETRVRIAIKLGRAAVSGLSHGEAIALLQETLADTQLPAEAKGELHLCLGILLRNQSRRAREGWLELERAVDELRGRPGPAARAMASLGAPYLTDGRHLDEHLGWLAAAARTAHRAGDPELAAVVEVNRATALVATGDPAGWRLTGPLPEDPTRPDLTRALGTHPMLTVNVAWAAVSVGRYPEAETLLRAGQRLASGSAGGYLGCALSGTALMFDYAVGNWEGLAARAEQVVRTASDVPSVAAEARLVLGLLALATGQLRDAEAHLAESTGSVPVAVAGDSGLARLAAANGDPVTAEQRVRRGLAMVRGKGVWCWSAELVPIAVAVLARTPEHQPAARKLLDEVAAGLTGRDAPLAEAALVTGRALLAEADGQHLAAAAQHAEAATAYAVLPRPYPAAQAWEARGRCLLAAGLDGTGALTEAAAVFEQLGAVWDVARCRHLLRSFGSPLSHRRGRRGYGRQLSPRERDVVRLVRTGLTNREVAEALFLSTRTVEAHVARALRKLGLPSRRALATSRAGAS
jgi:ATP/maltotriose-dependent transcriptional regulator MalT